MGSVYIATGIENAPTAREFQAAFQRAGWAITYDWTKHGSLQGRLPAEIRDVALKEVRGVLDANVLVVLLPGGRGTHTELGVGIASGKPIVLFAPDDEHLMGPHLAGSSRRHLSFYYLPQVQIARSLAEVVALAKRALT